MQVAHVVDVVREVSGRSVLRCFGSRCCWFFRLQTSLKIVLVKVLVGLRCSSAFNLVEVNSRCSCLFLLFR